MLQSPCAASYKGSGGTTRLLGTAPLTQLKLLRSLKMPSVPETGRELQPWQFVPTKHSRLLQGISLTNASIKTELLNFELFPSYACTWKNNSKSHFQTSNIQQPLCKPIAPVPMSPPHRVQSASWSRSQSRAECSRPQLCKGAPKPFAFAQAFLALRVEQGNCTSLQRFRFLFVYPLGFSRIIRSTCFINHQG